jgi:hypothetical protein
MKKILLSAIILITSASAFANTENGLKFLQKPTVNTSTLNVKGLTPILTTKCEAKCEMAFRSCMNQPAPVNWSQCYGEYTMCLFGIDGCNGI